MAFPLGRMDVTLLALALFIVPWHTVLSLNASETSLTGRTCSSCSACNASFYEAQPCTAVTDTVCEACQSCATGKFRARNCTTTTDTLCIDCAVCTTGEYKVSDCTATADTVCSRCAVCPMDEYISTTCAGTQNTICTNCSICTAGQYASTPCNKSSDRQCSSCDTCSSDKYASTPCHGSQNTICTHCRESCSAGQFEATACTSSTNRQCKGCSVCGVNQYRHSACTMLADAVCKNCSTCPAGYHVRTACSATANTVCHFGANEDSVNLVLLLADTDLNEIKRLTNLATGQASTFLGITKGAINDLNNNPVNEIPLSSALAVTLFKPDLTPPRLLSYSLDMTKGHMVLTFSETVNASSLQPAALTLQDAKTSATTSFQLSSASPSSNDSVVITVVLSAMELNGIKSLRNLAVNRSTTFLSASSGAMADMNGNEQASIADSHALQALQFIRDVVAPELLSFKVNLALGAVELLFSEAIDITSLKVAELILQNQVNGSTSLALTGASAQTLHNTAIALTLTLGDLNEIKMLPDLWTSQANTFVRFSSALVKDTFDNAIVQISSGNALQVDTFNQDDVPPTVIQFDFNLNNGQLKLYFSETINRTSLSVMHLFLQPATSSSADSLFQLSAVAISPGAATEVVVTLTKQDLNTIKRNLALATSSDNLFMSCSADLVTDMAGVAVVAIDRTNALAVTHFVPDTIAAQLELFILNMDTGVLQLVFSEPVNASSLSVSQITLQHNIARSTEQFVTLSTSSVGSQEDSTSIVITLAVADLNAIKRASLLAISINSTYITLSNTTVTDMAGNAVEAIADSSAQLAADFVPDTTAPELMSVQLDLDLKQLVLTFSETVDSGSLDVSALELYGSANGSSAVVALTGGNVTTPNGLVLIVTLLVADMNQIKFKSGLASSVNTTFVLLKKGGVQDTSGNDIEESARLQASSYTADTTAPVLLAFDMDMVAGSPPVIITLIFSETVLLPSFNVSALVLQSANANASTQLRLTTADNITQSSDSPENLSFSVSATDLASLRSLKGVARTATSSFLTADRTLINDHSTNAVLAISSDNALPISTHTIDITPPVLNQFDLSLATDTLTLTFSKAMVASTLNVARLTLLAGRSNTSDSYTLTKGAVTSVSSSVLSIALSVEDVDALKAARHLAVTRNTTFLAAADTFVQDVAENVAEEILAAVAVRATIFSADITAPTLEAYSLDMTLGLLALTFSEIMSAAAIDVTQFSLQSTKTSNLESFTLTGGQVSNLDRRIINITLSLSDANAIRIRPTLAVSINSTFLAVTSSGATDTSSNGLRSISSGSALQATAFEADTVPPIALGFVMDIMAGKLTLQFDKPVNGSSMQPNRLTLQGNNSTVRFNVTGGATTLALSTNVTLTLTEADLDEIKRLALCSPTVGIQDCFLHYILSPLVDVSGLDVTPIFAVNPLQATAYVPDTQQPTLALQGFLNFNLNLGQFTLKFSEIVDRFSVAANKITFQQLFINPEDTYTLTSLSVINTVDARELTFQLTTADLNAIKKKPLLCTRQGSCYIKLASGMLNDLANNALLATAVNDANLIAQDFTADTTRPQLTGFALNMDARLLTLIFDEVVSARSINMTAISFQSSPTDTAVHITGGGTFSADDLALEVLLVTADINAMKLLNIATTANQSFLNLEAGGVKDVASTPNEVVAVTNLQVQEDDFVSDSTAPLLSAFTFDLDTGILDLSFNEPVLVSSVNFTALVLQANKTSSEKSVRLTTGTILTSLNISQQLRVQLDSADMIAIKTNPKIGTAQSNTFLAADATWVLDVALVPAEAILSSSARQVAIFLDDRTQGQLVQFSLDLNSRQLVLFFDDVMDASTLRVEAITLQSARTAITGLTYSLTTSSTQSPDGTVIVITLTNADLYGLGSIQGLASSLQDTWLIISALALDDVTGSGVISITDGRALQANAFVADSTRPQIDSFTLSMGTGVLTVTFNEPINKTTWNAGEITLQQNATLGTGIQSFTLTSLGTTTFAGDATIATIILFVPDLHALQAAEPLVTSVDTTFLSHTDQLFSDLYGLTPVGIKNNNAMAVTTFIPDNVAPTLVSFVLDMNVGSLKLTFSETMRLRTLLHSEFTLQNNNGSAAHVVRNATVMANLTVFTFGLSAEDITAIKTLPNLASNRSNTFLSFTSAAIKDMADNNVTAIPSSNPLQAVAYHRDVTRPVLVAFTMDLNIGQLTLTFTEPMDYRQVHPNKLRIQDTANFTLDGAFALQLSDGEVSSVFSSILSVNLTVEDLNNLKALPELAVSKSSTFLAVSEEAAQDMSGNNMVALSINAAQQAENYVADSVNPRLRAFTLNINTSQLILTFSETVNTTALSTRELSIQHQSNAVSSTNTFYTLTGDSQQSSIFAAIVTITLSATDLNGLKVAEELAVNLSSTFLSATSALISDMSGNELVAITDSAGLAAMFFVADQVAPQLTDVSLDLTTDQLTLIFSEPVRASSFVTSNVILQGANVTSDAALVYRLSSDSTSTNSSNGVVIVLQLGAQDSNQIKARPLLVTTIDTSFLRLLVNAVQDMNGNGIVEMTAGLQMSSVGGDQVPPRVEQFSLDITSGLLNITFSETMNISSLLISRFVLQPGRNDQNSALQLSGGFLLTQGFERDITLQLSIADLNTIKQRVLLATSINSTYLVVLTNAGTDMSGNVLVTISNFAALQVAEYVADTQAPELTGFSIDMNVGNIHLTFSEVVLAASLNPLTIRLQHAAVISDNTSVVELTGGETSAANLAELTVTLAQADLHNLMLKRGLATSLSNSFVRLQAGVLKDMNGNVLLESVRQANVFVPDTTAPTLQSFTLDMQKESLQATFSEPVETSSVIPVLFTLRNTTNTSPAQSVTLSGGTATSGDGLVLELVLTALDVTALKKARGLATQATDSLLVLATGAIQDMNANNISGFSVGSALVASNYTTDTTSPTLSGYALDMNAGTLTMSFSEVMLALSLDPAFITLHDSAQLLLNFSLTGGTTASEDGAIIVVQLTTADRHRIKVIDHLATKKENTFLSLGTDFLTDMTGNPLVPVQGRQAQVYTADQGIGTLVAFDFDVVNGILLLEFSEPMNASSIQVTGITLQSQANASLPNTDQLTLAANSNASKIAATRINITLSISDLNAIQAKVLLAVNARSIFLSMTSNVAINQQGISVQAIDHENALPVRFYLPDLGGAPVLQAFSLNMNAQQLTLFFSKEINISSLQLTEITLQNAQLKSTSSVTLSAATEIVSSSNGTVLLQLGSADVDRLQLAEHLATSASTTWLSLTATAAQDMDGNNLAFVSSESALAVTNYQADTVNPELLKFDLDMNTGIMTLSFSEIMNVTSLRRNLFTLLSGKTIDGSELQLSRP